MAGTPHIYNVLGGIDSPVADEALGEALPLLAEPYRTHAAETLLRRGKRESLVQLIGAFHLVTEPVRAAAIERRAALIDALPGALRAPPIDSRVNALELIEQLADPRLCTLLAMAIRDAAPKVRETAATRLLRETTRQLAREKEPSAPTTGGTPLAELRQFVARAIGEAVTSFSAHHRLEAVEAAMLMPLDMPPDVLAAICARRGPYLHAMVQRFVTHDDPRLASYAYLGLMHPEARTHIVKRLETRCDLAFWVEMMRHSVLVRDPRIRQALGAIRRLAWLAGGFDAIADLPPDALQRFPAWLMATGLSNEVKVDCLLQVAGGDAAAAAVSAVWELTRLDGPAATRALERAARTGCPAVQRIAERALAHRRRLAARERRGAATAAQPVRKSGEEIFEVLWKNADRLDPRLARAAGRKLRSRMRGFFLPCRAMLLSQTAEHRSRAIRLVSMLGLVADFMDELAGLTSDEDVYVRSMAVAALGVAGGPTARRILERAMNDGDPRVVANAVAGLDRIAPDLRPELLLPLLAHPNTRLRTCAVRALLRRRHAAAAHELVRMLVDPRRMHRSNALGLISALRITAMAPRVREAAESDPDSTIRGQAARVLEALSQPAPPKPDLAQGAAS